MATSTTTITLNARAYELLKGLKQPGDSFSDVILAHTRPPAKTGGDLLKRLEEIEGMPLIDDELMRQVRRGRRRPANGSKRHDP